MTEQKKKSTAAQDVSAELSEGNDLGSGVGTLSSGNDYQSVEDNNESADKPLSQAKIDRQNSSFDSHSWGNEADFAPDKTNNPQEEFELTPAARGYSNDS